ncbi:hypothetical protein Tco_1519160 [Tanacetum coccineum]
MYPRFISILLGTQLKNIHVPLDHFPVNALTSKVFSFMVKKGKHFSGKVTPLFPSMLVQPTDAEGEASERPSEPKSPEVEGEALESQTKHQPTPSPPHQPADLHDPLPDQTPTFTPTIPASIPQGDGGNTGDQSSNDKSLSRSEDGLTLQSLHDLCMSLCKQVIDQAQEIKQLKAQVKKLKRRVSPLINHHKAWVQAIKIKKKGRVFKQGRKVVKSSKGEPSAHKDSAFEDFKDDFKAPLDDVMDYERIEGANEKDSTDLHEGTEKEKVSTDTQKVSTDRAKESTDSLKVSTDSTKLSTDKNEEGTDGLDDTSSVAQTTTPTTPTTTTATFGDDETIAKVLLNMSQARAVTREKEKGVELRDIKDSERSRTTLTRSILTLKPLPKIDPKDKGKKRIEEDDESSSELDEVTTTEKKFKQLSTNEELARKIQEDWEAEEERKSIAEEEAVHDALVQELDDVKARIEANRLLALRLQEEEREQFTIEERERFLHDTIEA